MSLAWLETPAMSMRDEFRAWLIEEDRYDEETAGILLDKDWDGCAYPDKLLGDDLLIDIANFLYYMARFAVERIYGEEYWKDDSIWIRILPDPSYEDRSNVYVLEMKGRRVLAEGCGGKTWNNGPQVIEYDLADLVRQLKESKLSCPVCGEKAKVEYICPEHGNVG